MVYIMVYKACVPRSKIPWYFELHRLGLTFTSAVSFPSLLDIRGSLISASDCAEDSVTNFTSAVWLESQVLVNDCRWT